MIPGPDIALLFTVSDHGAVATNLRPDRHRLLRPRQNDIRIVEERVDAAPDQQVLEAIGKDLQDRVQQVEVVVPVVRPEALVQAADLVLSAERQNLPGDPLTVAHRTTRARLEPHHEPGPG